MSEKGMEIVIRPDGETNIDMIGYSDGTCEQHAQPFVDALGGKVTREAKEGITQKNKNNVQQKRG